MRQLHEIEESDVLKDYLNVSVKGGKKHET